MNVIHLGRGSRYEQWHELVETTPRADNIGLVAEHGESGLAADRPSDVAVYPSLGDALAQAKADVAIVTGRDALKWASEALEAKLAVILDEPGAANVDTFQRFRDLATASGSSVAWLERYPYARCEWLLRRLAGSSLVGAIGHLSCMDQTKWDHRGREEETSQLSLSAFAHLAALGRLFRAPLSTVMARLTRNAGVGAATQAFLEFEGELRVHYSGCHTTDQTEHELWVEGAAGSVKSDGAAVAWRKRGWPRFLPLRPGWGGSAEARAEPRRLVRELAAGRRPGAPSPRDLWPIAAVVAAIESNRRGSPVALSELLPT